MISLEAASSIYDAREKLRSAANDVVDVEGGIALTSAGMEQREKCGNIRATIYQLIAQLDRIYIVAQEG